MKGKKVFKKLWIGILYCLTWFAIERIIILIFQGSPARKAYGLLSAWWAALYFCSMLKVKWDYFWNLVLCAFGYSFIVYLSGHDRYLTDIWALDIAAITFGLMSPFLINRLAYFLVNALQKRSSFFKEIKAQDERLP